MSVKIEILIDKIGVYW